MFLLSAFLFYLVIFIVIYIINSGDIKEDRLSNSLEMFLWFFVIGNIIVFLFY